MRHPKTRLDFFFILDQQNGGGLLPASFFFKRQLSPFGDSENMTMHPKIFTHLLKAAFLVLLLTSTAPVSVSMAREVIVFVPAEEGNSAAQRLEKAKQQAFVAAVGEEALSLLPASLPEERQSILMEYLAPRAGNYILSYSELSAEEQENGLQAVFDCKVNRSPLRAELQQIGIFHTARKPIRYNLVLQGHAAQAWEEIDRLQTLTGLLIDTSSEVSVTLAAYPEGKWSCSLTSAAGNSTAAGQNLEKVWFQVWSRYFEFGTKQSADKNGIVLEVSGWLMPDEAKAFGDTLRSWDEFVARAELIELSITPEGVTGKWDIRVSDNARLNQKMQEYVANWGLRYSLANL